jgi:hypothetical protein
VLITGGPGVAFGYAVADYFSDADSFDKLRTGNAGFAVFLLATRMHKRFYRRDRKDIATTDWHGWTRIPSTSSGQVSQPEGILN